MPTQKLRVLFLTVSMLTLSGLSFASEKGGNEGEDNLLRVILQSFEASGRCFVPQSKTDEETLAVLCNRLTNDFELFDSSASGIFGDRDLDNRLKFRNQCCF